MNKKFTSKIMTLSLICLCSFGLSANALGKGYTHSIKNVSTTNSLSEIAGIYAGSLQVDLAEQNGEVITFPNQLLITENGGDEIGLLLKDFDFGGLPLGDIAVENIPVSESNGEYQFESEKVNLSLAIGDAEVKASGTIKDNIANVTIDVHAASIDIPVKFTGKVVVDGLRLNDIKLNGVSVSEETFDPDVFHYSLEEISGSDVLTYEKADASSKVDILLDGKWIYLYVTDGLKSNCYAIAHEMNTTDFVDVPINKITLGQNVDGNLTLTNGAEISSNGTVTIAGTITYNKTIDGSAWNVVGLPYTPIVKAVKADGTRVDADAYWYTYDNDAKQKELSAPADAMIMKLKSNTDATSLDLISPNNSRIALGQQEVISGYTVLANNSLVSKALSSLAPVIPASPNEGVYYIFNGTEFIKANGDTKIAPATMFIAYAGATPAATIAVPNTDSGIDNPNNDGQSVYAAENTVYVKGFSGIVQIYTLNGNLYTNVNATGNDSFELPRGTYIVQTGSRATLIMIK
ncbi:calycin-like domain-containing protein [Dysgonomonas sp. 520]|uniref:calycin-like domain-containing protein n=1 Tax=Dysgonomonas sp. 520 TaxID=2302931 RepID=UPI0013D46C9A|nr:calycin-like domain-containing protein [Dysgonomonas sp. 520]NDW09907.1 hypothetical protein [Dysgonomonas sp. 520]